MNKPASASAKAGNLTAKDKAHIAHAQKMKKAVGAHIEKFEFHLAAEKAYHYFWHTFADKIIEEYKPLLKGDSGVAQVRAYRVLETILLDSLKMLHPFMPFVTEAVYEKFLPKKMLMVEEW